jgi:hypothetical protein
VRVIVEFLIVISPTTVIDSVSGSEFKGPLKIKWNLNAGNA